MPAPGRRVPFAPFGCAPRGILREEPSLRVFETSFSRYYTTDKEMGSTIFFLPISSVIVSCTPFPSIGPFLSAREPPGR
jgi:hypothetical protein